MASLKLRAAGELHVGVAFVKDTTSATFQAVLNALPIASAGAAAVAAPAA